MTNIKKVKGYMPVPARFKHLDEQRRNVQRALNSIPAGSDEQVGVTSNDTTPGYLGAKIRFNSLYFVADTTNPGGNERLEISPLVDNIHTEGGTIVPLVDEMEGQYVSIRFAVSLASKTITIPNNTMSVGAEITFFIERAGSNLTVPVNINPDANVTLRYFSAAGGAISVTGPATGPLFAGQYTAITIKKNGEGAIDSWDVIGNIA